MSYVFKVLMEKVFRKLSKNRYFLILILFCSIASYAQNWKPAMGGLSPLQFGNWKDAFQIDFRTHGPMGKDWIYGGFWTEDSLRRCVAYREGGKWVPLPFSGYYGNYATDIDMYGDTLYISGNFDQVVLDGSSDTLPSTSVLKWFNDSIWIGNQNISFAWDIEVNGDTMIYAGGSFIKGSLTRIDEMFMTTDREKTWQYPYRIVHPTDTIPDFGAIYKVKILPDGDILTLNNGSPIGNAFRGISRWDGLQ